MPFKKGIFNALAVDLSLEHKLCSFEWMAGQGLGSVNNYAICPHLGALTSVACITCQRLATGIHEKGKIFSEEGRSNSRLVRTGY